MCLSGMMARMNRVQSSPKIAHAMHSILSKVQAEEGSWVCLSVVHLGNSDVPNALVFIDKYIQVSRSPSSRPYAR